MQTKYPSPTIQGITEFLFIGQEEEKLTPSDLVIILGNHIIDIMMGEVAALYRKGKIKENATIILSGANGDFTQGQEPECEQMFYHATKNFGMPENLFIKENQATNAWLNMVYSKDIVEAKGGFDSFNNILLVGNSFLLRRASMYAAKLRYPMERMQYFGVYDREGRNISPDGWWKSEVSIQRVMAEIERIGKYYASGNMSIW